MESAEASDYGRLAKMIATTKSRPGSMTMTGSLGELACLFFGFDAAIDTAIVEDFHSWLEAKFMYRTEYGFVYYGWRDVFPERDHENFLLLPRDEQQLVFDKTLELAAMFVHDRIEESGLDTGGPV